MAVLVPVGCLLFLFLVSATLQVIRAQSPQNQSNNIISLGSSLTPKTHPNYWLSASGRFAFGFYAKGNGFAVGIWLAAADHEQQNVTVWTAHRDDPPLSSEASLNLTKDGKLLILTEQLEEKLIADVDQLAQSASMLDTGNFVLYSNSFSIIWQSFSFPTDTILGGQSFYNGSNLVCSESETDHSSGRFFIGLQVDGNLVAYPVNSSASPDDSYWSSQTPNTGFDVLNLNNEGLLYLNSTASKSMTLHVLANVSYYGNHQGMSTIYRATLDADGIFRLYSHHFEGSNGSNQTMEWSNLNNRCQVKGFCGLNSYCSGDHDMANCSCYPGFSFISENMTLRGCTQNFTEDVCEGRRYDLVALENMWWVDNPYAVTPMEKEECMRFCQDDCNCGAVVFSDGNCKSYKLPLRYGVQNPNMSNTAFFKMNLGSTPSDSAPVPSISPIIITKRTQGTLVLILAISLGFIASVCFVLAASSFFIYKHRVHSYRKLAEDAKLGLTEEFTLQPFTYEELEQATEGFKEEVGRGSFGAVYKGTLPRPQGNITVAVKRLERVEQGARVFQAEMTTIGRTNHRNLVRLLGFCVDGSRKLLVYEYMSNGSLAHFLFKAKPERPAWKDRVRLAREIARGLHYLHEECEVCIVHCNIKPQNILIDDSFSAKISEFGLSNIGVKGEREYSAPERQSNALMTSVKVDVYSFGIILLEIICCRSNIDLNVSTTDEILLSSWVYKCFVKGELNKLVEGDENNVNVDPKMLERMVKVGMWCIQEDPTLRPSMKNVILMLEGTMDVPLPPFPTSSLVI